MTNESVLAFDLPKNQSSVIKVIGVGGGGSNAVNYMFENGIDGVDFAVCNTDLQALEASPITTKIQIGAEITEGLVLVPILKLVAKLQKKVSNVLKNYWKAIPRCYLSLLVWAVEQEQVLRL